MSFLTGVTLAGLCGSGVGVVLKVFCTGLPRAFSPQAGRNQAVACSCFLSVYLPVSLSTCFFSELAAFAVSLPSCGKDHTAPGFLCIPLAAQAERASLLQCSGLGTDTHWPSLSPVPLPGSIVMTVIGQVMCSAWSQRVELIPSQPCDLRVGKG